MKIKCPYLSNDKFCTYKNGNESKQKTICIYSNAQKCHLYREWDDKLNMYTKCEKVDSSPKVTYKDRVKLLIKKWEK